jgi:hypothetical protein
MSHLLRLDTLGVGALLMVMRSLAGLGGLLSMLLLLLALLLLLFLLLNLCCRRVCEEHAQQAAV